MSSSLLASSTSNSRRDQDEVTAGGFSLRDDEFEAIRSYLYQETGIALGNAKRDLVCSRLAKRMRHFELSSFGEYLQNVRKDEPAGERQEFINCLTTNKTDFFREPHHFDFLRDKVIPGIRASGKRRLRIWSAGCSTGEEPYSIAMTLRDHCPELDSWDVKILASDIDTAVLASAQRGIYSADRVSELTPDFLGRHFLRGQGDREGKVAVRPELRKYIAFRQVNLIEDNWPIRTQFDVIFCRNVVIYFDHETQSKLLTRFSKLLDPHGYMILGHSENIHWMMDTFAPLGATVYSLRQSTDTPPPVKKVELPKPEPKEDELSVVLGDVKVTRGKALLKTLLGSCVSACLYDPETGVGGMNHFSLPGTSDEGMSARYGAHAMELLITAIMKKGGDRNRLRAKVFGGGKVLNIQAEHLNVGARNADFVQKYLQTEGIPIMGQSLGGNRGMIVKFRPYTGQCHVKPLQGRELPPVVAQEEQYCQELQRNVDVPADDGITLF